jgi:hypothetical protein
MGILVGQKFKTPEHSDETIGTVIRVNEAGDATIEWVTPRNSALPYGCINTEFWPVSDHHLLTAVA